MCGQWLRCFWDPQTRRRPRRLHPRLCRLLCRPHLRRLPSSKARATAVANDRGGASHPAGGRNRSSYHAPARLHAANTRSANMRSAKSSPHTCAEHEADGLVVLGADASNTEGAVRPPLERLCCCDPVLNLPQPLLVAQITWTEAQSAGWYRPCGRGVPLPGESSGFFCYSAKGGGPAHAPLCYAWPFLASWHASRLFVVLHARFNQMY